MAASSFKSFVQENQTALSPLFSDLPDFQINNPTIVSDTAVKGEVEISNLSGFDMPPGIPEMLPSVAIEVTISVILANKVIKFLFNPSGFSIPLPDNEKLTLNDPEFSITTTVTQPFNITYEAGGKIPIHLDYSNETIISTAQITFVTKEGDLTSATVGMVLNPTPPVTLPSILQSIITLNQVSVEMGLLFNPDICLIGIGADASMKIPFGELSAEDFIIVCAIEGDVPVPIYISFSTEDLDLSILISMLYPEYSQSFSTVKLVQPYFSWCDKPGGVPLPDGTSAPQGFSFSAEFELFGLSFYGALTYANNKVLSGSFQYSGPINIGDGVFKLSGDGKAIPAKTGVKNNHISTTQSDAEEVNQKVKQAENAAPLCEAGGVVFDYSFSPFTSISVKANGTASFLDLVSTSLNVQIENDYIEFDFSFDEAISVNESLKLQNGQLTGSISFGIGKDVNLLPGNLNFINLSSSNKVTCGITVSDSSFSIALSLYIENTTINLGTNSLTDCSTIEDLMEQATEIVVENAAEIAKILAENPSLLINGIENGLLNLEKQDENMAMTAIMALHYLGIPFSGQFGRYLGDIQQQLNYTAEDMQTAVSTVSTELLPAGLQKITPGTILCGVGQALETAIKAEPLKYLESIEAYMPSGVATFMKNELNSTEMDVVRAFKDADVAAKDTAQALTDIYHISKSTLDDMLKGVGYATDALEDVEGYLKDVATFLHL